METRVEVLVQTFQGPASCCTGRAGALTGLGEDPAVSMLGKEGAVHCCTLCDSPSPVGEDIPL